MQHLRIRLSFDTLFTFCVAKSYFGDMFHPLLEDLNLKATSIVNVSLSVTKSCSTVVYFPNKFTIRKPDFITTRKKNAQWTLVHLTES